MAPFLIWTCIGAGTVLAALRFIRSRQSTLEARSLRMATQRARVFGPQVHAAPATINHRKLQPGFGRR